MWYDKFNIKIPNGKFSGEVATTCPECSHTRDKKSDKCLGVNLTKQVFKCNHCGWKGGVPITNAVEVQPVYEYVKPEWSNKTQLSDKVVKWFEGRGIRQKTLQDAQITEGVEYMPQASKECNTIQFNYFLEGVLVNIKYRSGAKHFKMHKGAELIPYNAHAIWVHSNAEGASRELIITEGEIDCLSFIEAGITNVISVPNGASANTNNLSYLDRFSDQLEKIDRFIIATDNDEPGRKLRYDLAFRLGIDKCQYIDFGTHKDANEVLIAENIGGIHRCLNEVKHFPIEGAFGIGDFENEVYDLFINGLKPAYKIGLPEVDAKLTFERGYMTGITGIPSHGKSDFVDQLTIGLSLQNDWKTAYFSPENKPTQLHISKLIRKLIGRYPERHEVDMALMYLKDKMFFIEPEEDFNIDSILTRVKQLKTRHGIDAFVIDAWNKLDHRYDNSESETKYTGRVLDQLARFCTRTNVHLFLVVHPTKMKKKADGTAYEMPTLYDMSGSANFANKLDNGLCVYRDFVNNKVIINVLKVKFSHWGETDQVELMYDGPSGRYHTNFDLSPWIKSSTPLPAELPPMKMKPNKDFTVQSGEADFLKEAESLDF